jgi:hypothetical protein
MNPDPLYMTLKNMTQSPHSDRPYAGNLAGAEYVHSKADWPSVTIADEDAGEVGPEELMGLRNQARMAVEEYIQRPDSGYRLGDKAHLIEIRVVDVIER